MIMMLNAMDQKYSEYIHYTNSIAVELVLFPFAHMFNRFYSIIGILLSLIVGAYRYDNML